MGSAASPPSKKAPAKKGGAGSSKPNRPATKPKTSKAKVGSGVDPPITLSAAAAAVVGQHQHPLSLPLPLPLLIPAPTNLPVCIVDNGGWTVKYGIVVPPPPSALAVTQKSVVQDDLRTDVYAKASDSACATVSSMYNATARPPHQLTVLAGDEITSRMKNLGQLSWSYPLERGMICDGETQLRVWARVLEVLGVVPVPAMPVTGGGGFLTSIAAARRGKPVVSAMTADAVAAGQQQRQTNYSSNCCAFFLLEPPFVPSVISEGVDCMLFRELGMARVARMVGPCMAASKYLSMGQSISDNNDPGADGNDHDAKAKNNGEWINDNTKCCCVVDSGHSFTHVVPTHHGGAVIGAIRRLNVGGKVLTNLLKEAVTYRQWNMMDEYHIVNDAKEQLCFVSDRFDEEMKLARAMRKGFRWFDREYLLPDMVTTFSGSVRLPEPLQRKKDMDEMERIKREMDSLKDEKDHQELLDEARDLSNTPVLEEMAEADKVKSAKDTSNNKEGKRVSSKSSKSKTKKKRKRNPKKDNHDSTTTDDEDDDGDIGDSDDHSDEESNQQRLQRLKAMRDAERRRREKESLERQALAMSVERFAIPEVLFRPSDIGLDCGGIVEAIVESIDACDDMLKAAMYHNILLVGGNSKIPGFRERVELELRRLAPTNYTVRIYLPDDPAVYVWEGAKQFSTRPAFQDQFSVDRLSWEAMKKAGKNQQDIWGTKMYNIT